MVVTAAILRVWSWDAMAASLVRPLLSQLFTALAALQGLGCTHRDVKPDNIMVS